MSKKRTSELSVHDLLKLKKGDFTIKQVKEKEIDCSDIPELTAQQMRGFKRLGKSVIADDNLNKSRLTKSRKTTAR